MQLVSNLPIFSILVTICSFSSWPLNYGTRDAVFHVFVSTVIYLFLGDTVKDNALTSTPVPVTFQIKIGGTQQISLLPSLAQQTRLPGSPELPIAAGLRAASGAEGRAEHPGCSGGTCCDAARRDEWLGSLGLCDNKTWPVNTSRTWPRSPWCASIVETLQGRRSAVLSI